MPGYPVVTVASGGLPVTLAGSGLPVEEASSGLAVTFVASGGLPIAEAVAALRQRDSTAIRDRAGNTIQVRS